MRKIVIGTVVLGALVLAGCDDKSSGGASGAASGSASAAASVKGAPSAAPSGSAAKAEEKKKEEEGPKDHAARAKALAEAWASHDAKKVAALYTEDAVLKFPGRPEIKGRAAIEKHMSEMFGAFKDATVTNGRVWEKDKHTAVVEWLDKGTNNGEWPAAGLMKATNKPYGVIGASWIEVDDHGLIKEEHTYLDLHTLMGQLMEEKKNPVRGIVAALPDGMAHVEMAEMKLKEAKDDKEKAELAKAVEMEKKDMEAEDKFIGAMNSAKLDDSLKLLADDVKLIDYTQTKDISGKAAAKEMFKTWMVAFPDMKVKSLAAFPAGDFVVEEFQYQGTQKGPLGPIKATNKPVDIHQLEIDQFKDGKLVKAWSFGNGLEMMGELGLLHEDKKEEKKEEKKK